MNYRNMTNDELLQVVDDLNGHIRPEYAVELAARLTAAENTEAELRTAITETEEEAASIERDADWFRDLVADALPLVKEHGADSAWVERAEARL